ncbi:MAG: hypothetical protein JNM19_00230 [Chitinophagaceae bacterium]|nr:hypothetical protein [Chitinophagaceae bacterium]
MKKVLLSASLLLIIAVTTAFAKNDPGITEELKASFEKEFAGAESVRWLESGDYYRANFVYQGCVTEAYYNKEGELEGSVRSLFFNQLPISVMTSVNKRFASADVLDVYEINNANGTRYRLTLTSQKKKYRVLLDASGNILEKERIKS